MTLAQMIARQAEIVAAAKAESRELTAEEQKEFDGLQTKIEEARQAETATKAAETERARIAAINTVCREFDFDATPYINDPKATVETARAAILDNMKKSGQPHSVKIEKDEADKFRGAAVDAMMIKGGNAPEKPVDGARELSHLSLRSLALECSMAEGGNLNERMSNDDLYASLARDFYNPNAAFPSIVEQTIKKVYEKTYSEVSSTYERWVSEGTLSDFKKTNGNYYAGAAGDFKKVLENGELVADKPADHKKPSRQLETYGRQFSMTRQAFINDDIGFMSTLPSRYAASAKRTINKQVYGLLYNNSTIFDNKALFHADHKNLIASGTKPTAENIQTAILKLQLQTDDDGTQINVRPRYIVVPVGYGFELTQVLNSPTTIGGDSNPLAVNPLYRSGLEVIEDATLNGLAGANACPWFIVADKNDALSIQVDYLNGQKVPTIVRHDATGLLGFAWDIYLDWGVTAVDFRGIVKNPGTTL